MAKGWVRGTKYGAIGGAVLGIGVGASLLIPPLAPVVGGIIGLQLAEGAAAFSLWTAVGAIATAGSAGGTLGATAGITSDQIERRQRARVVQILGPFQSGKNSVYNTIIEHSEEVDPTTIGTKSNYRGKKKTQLKILAGTDYESDAFVAMKEVSGEKSQRYIWEEILRESNPHGILYIVDSPTMPQSDHREREKRFQEEVDGLIDIVNVFRELQNKRLTAFMILINKVDRLPPDQHSQINSLSGEYRKKLLMKQSNGEAIENHLREILPTGKPIRIAAYCAQWEESTNYAPLNKQAIGTFKADFHRG